MNPSASAPPIERPRRFHFDWLIPTLISPRRLFAQLAQHDGDTWLTPLLVLALAALGRVWAVGNVRQVVAASGQITLPPGSEFWTPEQQQQFFQAQQATSSPMFIYGVPAIGALIGIFVGWVVVAGLLHLLLTLLGGRSSTRTALNFVAWANLPFAVREIVRLVYALSTQKLVVSPGLAGFLTADGTALNAFVVGLLALVDFYLIWHLVLIVIGARAAASLPLGKTAAAAVITLALVLAAQTAPGIIASQLGGLSFGGFFF